MKTIATILVLLGISSMPTLAQLHASGTGSGGHGQSGSSQASSSGGQAVFGHPYGGPYCYGGPWWWGYPYWYYYPGYYDYYPYPYYSPSESPDVMGGAYSPSGATYKQLGGFWGKNLKNGTSTRDQFIDYLKSDLVRTSDTGRSLFEQRFVRSYGKNGKAVLDRALKEARAESGEAASESAGKE